MTPATATTAGRTALGRTARRRGAGVERDHARHLNALAALADFAMNCRAFRSVLQAGILQSRDVKEDVWCAIGGRDETKTLFRIEPLNAAPQFTCGTALILIGHVQLSVEDPTRGAPTPRPTGRRSAPSCNAAVSMGPICDKKQARLGEKRELKGPSRCLRASLHPLCSTWSAVDWLKSWLNTGRLADKIGSGKHDHRPAGSILAGGG